MYRPIHRRRLQPKAPALRTRLSAPGGVRARTSNQMTERAHVNSFVQNRGSLQTSYAMARDVISIFAQVSWRVTVRLKTVLPGLESGFAQYPGGHPFAAFVGFL